jgi:mannosyl-oligosaccharide alpha-1,2-mannosidase
MYRITGDQYWRDRGWEMFTAVQDHTRSLYGNSAIDDVTREAPEMEVCL